MPTTKPRKQRKMLFQAPLHRRYKIFSAPLAPELRESQRIKTLPVRVGDTVMITRGDHKGFEGKITRVDRKKYRVFIEGLTREKVDGTTLFVGVHPSKVMITKLSLDDKWRREILKRKKQARKAVEEAEEAEEKRVEKLETEKAEIPPEKPKAEPKKPRAKKKKTETKAKTAEKTEVKPKRKTKRKTAKTSAKRAGKSAKNKKEKGKGEEEAKR